MRIKSVSLPRILMFALMLMPFCLSAETPVIEYKPLTEMLAEISPKYKHEIDSAIAINESIINLPKMDEFMNSNPELEDIRNFTVEQLKIISFFEQGCGFYIIPGKFVEYGKCDRYENMSLSDFVTFKNWYWKIRPHLAKPYLQYYCYLLSVRDISSWYKNNENDDLKEIFFLSTTLWTSLHLIFYWYQYEGDNNSIPPVEIINYKKL